jgi:hypothetical protein
MPRFARSAALRRMYASLLERLLPRLEELLGVWLARLEAKVTTHEIRYDHASEDASARPQKQRRAVKADLDIGKPSVILLGARLNSDRQFCRTLMRRAAGLLRERRYTLRRDPRQVSRVAEYCQQ